MNIWLPRLAILFGLVMLGFLAVNAVLLWRATQPFEPLGDYPVQVVHNRLPGIEGPALYLGDTARITGTKCVNAKEPIPVMGRSIWISRDERAPNIIWQGPGVGQVSLRSPGCTTRIFANVLPEGITPGTWRLEGSDTATQGSRQQVKPYWSEDFRILPQP